MMHIYTTCGVWEFGATTGWVFSADEKGARLLLLESSSTLEVFKRMVLEDFDMEEDSLPDLELSYLPTELINTSTCPPVIIANDRQLQNFVGFIQKCVSTRLCVTSKAKVENLNEPDFDLNKSPADSKDVVVVNVLPPESRKSVGRNRKRRYETVEDKIRSSQTSQKRQPRKCSRCGISGHNRATCWSVQVCKLWCLKVQYCLVSCCPIFQQGRWIHGTPEAKTGEASSQKQTTSHAALSFLKISDKFHAATVVDLLNPRSREAERRREVERSDEAARGGETRREAKRRGEVARSGEVERGGEKRRGGERRRDAERGEEKRRGREKRRGGERWREATRRREEERRGERRREEEMWREAERGGEKRRGGETERMIEKLRWFPSLISPEGTQRSRHNRHVPRR
uniref:Uncharacterized protein n=1 Tax=Brassica oleracea var. oleracea TaxID=109376 RepID=A0A0D3AU05_BRAOL